MNINVPKLKGKSGTIKGARTPLVGARVKCIRQSQRTGGITVEFLEDRRPYKCGDHLHVYQYEFEVDTYKRIEVTNPAYARVVAMREAGKEVCDSDDHNEDSGCSNPACFNSRKPVTVTDGRGRRADVSSISIADESDRAGYWCHCPVCDARTLCEIAATPLRSGLDWSKYTCGECDTEFEYPTRHAQPVTYRELQSQKPEKRYVLCTNDYPYKVLPAGTTNEEVVAMIKRLNDLDEKWRDGQRDLQRPVYYHAHEVSVIGATEMQPIEDRR